MAGRTALEFQLQSASDFADRGSVVVGDDPQFEQLEQPGLPRGGRIRRESNSL
jgi:hypothetical protein